jgi:multisubunit Na+/H+ antiporter MnhB subunit
MGLVIVLDEVGLFSAPALYAPAGGVSGRTTLAVVIWLIAWAVLHRRWKNRHLESPSRVYLLALILIGVGVVLTLPPVWGLF